MSKRNVLINSRFGDLKLVMFLVLFCVMLLSSEIVLAHPPSNVDLNYDFENQKLSVTITHNSDNTETHYIQKVEVYRNGVTLIQDEYTGQPDDNVFTLSFDVTAEEGDVLKVEAECSIAGKNEESLAVIAGNGGSIESDDTSTPGFELFLVVVGIVSIIFLKKKKSLI